MKILIVDDEQLIREVIKEYCSVENYETKECDNGCDAIELIKKEDFDCIILDIMMPRMDGFTTLKNS